MHTKNNNSVHELSYYQFICLLLEIVYLKVTETINMFIMHLISTMTTVTIVASVLNLFSKAAAGIENNNVSLLGLLTFYSTQKKISVKWPGRLG